MYTLRTVSMLVALAAGSTALAGPVINLAPGQQTDELTGISNSEFTEILGDVIAEQQIEFEIRTRSAGLLYEGTLVASIVRSYSTGNLNFNYQIMDTNDSLSGVVSYVDITGFRGLETRVEYSENEESSETEGPGGALRSIDGDILSYQFEDGLSTGLETNAFFALVDTNTFIEYGSLATIYLESGHSVGLVVHGAGAAVPAPGSLALLGGAGLLAGRRRR